MLVAAISLSKPSQETLHTENETSSQPNQHEIMNGRGRGKWLSILSTGNSFQDMEERSEVVRVRLVESVMVTRQPKIA